MKTNKYVSFVRHKTKLLMMVFGLLSGCAVGPLMVHETARTVGDRRDELSVGYGATGFDFKWHHGFHDNLDLGFQVEALSAGVRGKWAVVNNQTSGPSLALATGVGFNWNGSHVYGDLIGSYLAGSWEPYTSLRGVQATNNQRELKESETGKTVITIPRNSFQYGQYTLGTRFWFNQKFMMNVEASKLFSEEPEFDDVPVLFSINLGLQY